MTRINSKTKERTLLICIVITAIAMVFEIYYGFYTNCLVLFSDGIHMLSHVFSLFVSYLGFYLLRKTKSEKYGKWAAFINSFSLVIFSIPLLIEAYYRFSNPESIKLFYTFVIGLIGLFVNLVCAFLLNKSGLEDLNSKSAYLHMLGDLLTSFSIIISVGIIYFFNWKWIDPFLTIVLCFFMVYWGIDLALKTYKSTKLNPL